MVARLDITDQKFGMLTAKRRTDSKSGTSYKWVCLCDCGGFACVSSNNLRTGHTDNCGCQTRIKKSKVASTHGKSKTDIYKIWNDIKYRCYNPNATGYHVYGGRGIKMQDSWLNDFDAFYNYIGEKPFCSASIDRIDNDGNYCEGNIKWSNRKQQTRNKGMYSNNNTGVTGVNLVFKKSSWYYIAVWEENGKQRNKVFSINKYGIIPAMAFAIKTREEKLNILKQFEGYSQKHGNTRKEIINE